MQPVTEMMEGAIQNSLFVDPFGYMWMVHQINQELNFEERTEILEKKCSKEWCSEMSTTFYFTIEVKYQ